MWKYTGLYSHNVKTSAFGIVWGYAQCCQAPRIQALDKLSTWGGGGVHQGILKWVYEAGNMVNLCDQGLSACSSDKWMSLRNFLMMEQVFSMTTFWTWNSRRGGKFVVVTIIIFEKSDIIPGVYNQNCYYQFTCSVANHLFKIFKILIKLNFFHHCCVSTTWVEIVNNRRTIKCREWMFIVNWTS
jgi:hypothetical protein